MTDEQALEIVRRTVREQHNKMVGLRAIIRELEAERDKLSEFLSEHGRRTTGSLADDMVLWIAELNGALLRRDREG